MNAVLKTDERRLEPAAAIQRAWAAVSWLPMMTFAVPIVFAAVAFVRVGNWPYYSHPDPKDLRLPVLHVAALLCYPIALFSFLARGLAAVIWLVGFRKRDLLVFLIGAVLWLVGLPIVGPLLGWLGD